jgi:serine phosphatase RsbU (regulator of sigma subunit)
MKRFFFRRRRGRGPDRTPEDPRESSGLLTGDAAQDTQSLEILLDTIAEVNGNIDLDRVLEEIVDNSLKITQAERAIVFLGCSADEVEIRLARNQDGQDLGRDLQYSRSVVRRSLEEGNAVRSVVQSDQEALELGQSVFDLKLRAVMCAPMHAKQRMVGAIYVDSRAVRREFSSRDLALFGALSAQLASAVENARLYADSLEKVRLEKDAELAQRIQHHLLSPVPQGFAGLDLALRYRAAEEASGDTYDFINMSGGRLAVLMGDVTGHGVGAALITHAAQAAVRSYLELLDDLSQVVTRLNQRLVSSVETGNFMSMLLVLVDPQAGNLHFVNAGHPGLIHCRADGSVCLEKTGMVLGVVAEQEYRVEGPIPVRPGDLLFLRTDGVDEAMSPSREVFGEARILSLLDELRGSQAEAALTRVDEALLEHTEGAASEDDLTMIAIRIEEP